MCSGRWLLSFSCSVSILSLHEFETFHLLSYFSISFQFKFTQTTSLPQAHTHLTRTLTLALYWIADYFTRISTIQTLHTVVCFWTLYVNKIRLIDLFYFSVIVVLSTSFFDAAMQESAAQHTLHSIHLYVWEKLTNRAISNFSEITSNNVNT